MAHGCHVSVLLLCVAGLPVGATIRQDSGLRVDPGLKKMLHQQ